MRQLFAVGYEMASKGFPWAKIPPGFSVDPAETPVPTHVGA